MEKGRKRLKVYHQTLMGRALGCHRWPTNLSKVSQIRQGCEETPEVFLERLIEDYKTYIPLNREAPENWSIISPAFVN